MSEDTSNVQISKLAAAQRQLDSAIRMFFQSEDELAIHTVAAAAFQILRDVTKSRGEHFTTEVFRVGILDIAKRYASDTLPPNEKAMIEGSDLMSTIEDLIEVIRTDGDAFDSKRINAIVTKQHEHKLWLSDTTSFLKHADRDAESYLSADRLDNEKMLMAASAAYIEVMKLPTPEIAAYFAFWSAKNNLVDDLAEEIQEFARLLESTNDLERYKLCAKFIRDKKTTLLR